KRHRGLYRDLGRLVDMLRKPVLEEPDTHVDAFTAGGDPSEYRQPDHQETRQLVGPDQGLAQAASEGAERHATEERRDQRATDEQRRLVESARERAKHRHFCAVGGNSVATPVLTSVWMESVRQIKARRCAPRVPCPISIRTWPVRSPGLACGSSRGRPG